VFGAVTNAVVAMVGFGIELFVPSDDRRNRGADDSITTEVSTQ
jgi:hypothetical protein